MSLPKQLIVKSLAEFFTQTADVEIGDEYGYVYKGSDKSKRSDKTLMLYATDGVLVNELLNDPYLKKYDCVIVDELHERKVQIDFLLYLLRNALNLRPELKIILMSATVDKKLFESYFSNYKFNTINIRR